MTFNKTNPPDKSIDVQPNQKNLVYILKCADGSFYVGSAQDLEDRLKRHNSGNGAAYTALRRPVRLVYQEPCKNLEDAVSRERQIKKWSRAKKEALINGEFETLKKLSKSRDI
jgi:putative endonuclease